MKLDNITIARRRYEDSCTAAHALDLLGERWALLVVRELIFGPRRFGDLRNSLPGLSANVLTQRLTGLEQAGVVQRRRLPPPAAVQVYALTEWGQELEPVVCTLGRWATRSPQHDPALPLSAAAFLLSLRTLLDRGRAAGLAARIGFRMDGETFLATLADGRMAIAAGPLDTALLVLDGAPATLAAAIHGGQPLDALEAAGLLRVSGDRGLAARLMTLFPMPEKAARPGE